MQDPHRPASTLELDPHPPTPPSTSLYRAQEEIVQDPCPLPPYFQPLNVQEIFQKGKHPVLSTSFGRENKRRVKKKNWFLEILWVFGF